MEQLTQQERELLDYSVKVIVSYAIKRELSYKDNMKIVWMLKCLHDTPAFEQLVN